MYTCLLVNYCYAFVAAGKWYCVNQQQYFVATKLWYDAQSIYCSCVQYPVHRMLTLNIMQ